MAFQITDPGAGLPQRILALAGQRGPRCGPVTVIGVDGPSGSGKSSLADALAAAAGIGRAGIVRTDDLIAGWHGAHQAPELLVEQVLGPLSRGEPAAYRRWDWTHNRYASTVPVPAGSLLIVEGCACTVGAAGEYASVRVWVEAPRGVRMRRGLDRDGAAYAPYWQAWADQESAIFGADRTRERADLVVRTG